MTRDGLDEIYNELDRGIADIVMLLRENWHNTFTSCEGGKGHAFNSPTVRIKPKDVKNMQPECDEIARLLSKETYGGYYLKQCYSYQCEAQPWGVNQPHFIEVEFWAWEVEPIWITWYYRVLDWFWPDESDTR